MQFRAVYRDELVLDWLRVSNGSHTVTLRSDMS